MGHARSYHTEHLELSGYEVLNPEQPEALDAHHHVWTLIVTIFMEAALVISSSVSAKIVNPVAATVAAITIIVATVKARQQRLWQAQQVYLDPMEKLADLRAEICRTWEEREGCVVGSAKVHMGGPHCCGWSPCPPADTVVMVSALKPDGQPWSLTSAGKGEEQGLRRLLACLKGEEVPPVG